LKKATRGVSKGKWNAPGGKIEEGETPESNARREVFEETGLKVTNLFFHGIMLYFMGGSKTRQTTVGLFSSRNAIGQLSSTVEGRLKWFQTHKLPFDEMWDDDKYWVNLMLIQGRFNAKFYFNITNTRVTRYEILSR